MVVLFLLLQLHNQRLKPITFGASQALGALEPGLHDTNLNTHAALKPPGAKSGKLK